jgi:hypothetical protein
MSSHFVVRNILASGSIKTGSLAQWPEKSSPGMGNHRVTAFGASTIRLGATSRAGKKPNAVDLRVDGFVKVARCRLTSFPRRRESSYIDQFWTPACAGVTSLGLFTKPSILLNIQFLFKSTALGFIPTRLGFMDNHILQ